MSWGNRYTFVTGETNVAVAGTAEQMPDVAIPQDCVAVITAKPTNTGRIYIGETKAKAEAHTASLGANDVAHAGFTNLNAVWIDADNNGEGVDYAVPQ